jgi:hypothetical protein
VVGAATTTASTASTTVDASTAPPTTSNPRLPQGSEQVGIDPARFTTAIDNPYFPMTAGTMWSYDEVSADGTVQHVEVTVLAETKQIAGVETRVIHDLVTEDGAIVEDTLDYYAQDDAGNIWYFGEETAEYENGKVVSTAGTWEAGVDDAQPGIALPANPTPGLEYRQEFLAGEAEDQARILSIDEFADVASGSYSKLLMTRETTPLEPGLLEYKFYARGVGQVLGITVAGGSDRQELLSMARG